MPEYMTRLGRLVCVRLVYHLEILEIQGTINKHDEWIRAERTRLKLLCLSVHSSLLRVEFEVPDYQTHRNYRTCWSK